MNKPANKKQNKRAKAIIKKKRANPQPKKKRKKIPNPKGIGGYPKGYSGNPRGRPKDSPEIKAIRDAVKEDLINAVGWAIKIKDLRKVKKSELTLLEAGVLKSFQKYKQTGNFDWIKYPMDHVIGRPKETIDLETEGGNIVYHISPDYVPDFADNAKRTTHKSK